MIKIIVDLLLGIILLPLSVPFILIAVLLIVIEDKQSPFFTQKRMGKNKKLFTIFKLRTMKNNSVTNLGGFLRKTGLDELPQLINILLLQMSFVGPRPLTQSDIERLGWDGVYYEKRWNVRPGITGLAQLSPICHKKMSWFLDLNYILKNSFKLDVAIIFSSFLIPLLGKEKAMRLIHIRKKYGRTR